MALVVETGSGVVAANSYQTQSIWEAYAEQMGWLVNGVYTTGVAYTDEQIEAALIRGARAIDRWHRWPGVRSNGEEQGLFWPRKAGSIQYGAFYADGVLLTVTNREGLAIAINAIPAALVQAQAEAAWRELQDPGVLEPDLEQKMRSFSAGSVSITYADGASARSKFSVIDGLLDELIPETAQASGAMVNLLKA